MDNLMPCTLFFVPSRCLLCWMWTVDVGRGCSHLDCAMEESRPRRRGGGLPRTTDERTRIIFSSTFLHAITIVREFIITRSSSLVILNIWFDIFFGSDIRKSSTSSPNSCFLDNQLLFPCPCSLTKSCCFLSSFSLLFPFLEKNGINSTSRQRRYMSKQPTVLWRGA